MSQVIQIQDIAQYVGQQVQIKGWLYHKTGKGKLQFLQVRDGTGIVQAVAFKKDMSPEAFEHAKSLSQESSIIIDGSIREDDRAPGLPGGYEIGLSDLQLVQQAEEYPISPKEHGAEFLADHRHLWIRSSRQWAILRVRATVIRSIRDWLDDHGYLLVDTPILTPAAGEGTTTLFPVEYFGIQTFLAQTGQLYNEANIQSFSKVYCFGPTFRAEKSKTRRHLTEFWMVEPEIAYCDLDQLMEVEEQFLSYVVQRTIEERKEELQLLERDLTYLEKVVPPFPRISYDDALDKLAELRQRTTDQALAEQLAIEWGSDFGSPHETELTKLFEKPVFVYGYPTACKAFYMEPWPGRPEVSKSVDLLAPEGYGEIIGGSERIADADLLESRIKEHSLPVDAFKWYIDIRRFGSIPHSGFGLGVERTVAWITGINHIRETIPYPRTINRIYP